MLFHVHATTLIFTAEALPVVADPGGRVTAGSEGATTAVVAAAGDLQSGEKVANR